MARKVRRRRRHNPIRTTGMLVVNPARRARRKSNPRRKARKSNPRRSNPRRSRALVRRNPRKRAYRRNPARRVARRRNPTHRTAAPTTVYSLKMAPRSNPRHRRRNPGRRRRNPGRRHIARRRNPGIASTLKSIPVVGPVLASMATFVPQAAFGAVSVEPTMWLAKFLGPWMPAMLPSGLLYAGTGLLLGALLQMKWVPLSAGMKKDLAIAAASAGGALAYYKWRMPGQAETVAEEMGLLELAGVGNFGLIDVYPGALNGYAQMGDPSAYSVGPYNTSSESYAGVVYGQ